MAANNSCERKKVDHADMEEVHFAMAHGRSVSRVKSRYGTSTGRSPYAYAILTAAVLVPSAFAAIPAQAAGPAIVGLGTAGGHVPPPTPVKMTGAIMYQGAVA